MKNLLKKKDFAEAGALYFIATLFNKGIGFVTVPIFSRILTTSDYGTVTTFNSWVSMISVFTVSPLESFAIVGADIICCKSFFFKPLLLSKSNNL